MMAEKKVYTADDISKLLMSGEAKTVSEATAILRAKGYISAAEAYTGKEPEKAVPEGAKIEKIEFQPTEKEKKEGTSPLLPRGSTLVVTYSVPKQEEIISPPAQQFEKVKEGTVWNPFTQTWVKQTGQQFNVTGKLPSPPKIEVKQFEGHRTVTFEEMQAQRINWGEILSKRIETVEKLPVINLMVQYRKEVQAWKEYPASTPKFVAQVGEVLAGSIEGTVKLPVVLYTMVGHAIVQPYDFIKTMKTGLQTARIDVVSGIEHYRAHPEELAAHATGIAAMFLIGKGAQKITQKITGYVSPPKVEQLKYTDVKGIQYSLGDESLVLEKGRIGFGKVVSQTANEMKITGGGIIKEGYYDFSATLKYLDAEKRVAIFEGLEKIAKIKEGVEISSVPVQFKGSAALIGKPKFTELGKGYFLVEYQHMIKGLSISPEGFSAPKGIIKTFAIMKMPEGGGGKLSISPTVFPSSFGGASPFPEMQINFPSPTWAVAAGSLTTFSGFAKSMEKQAISQNQNISQNIGIKTFQKINQGLNIKQNINQQTSLKLDLQQVQTQIIQQKQMQSTQQKQMQLEIPIPKVVVSAQPQSPPPQIIPKPLPLTFPFLPKQYVKLAKEIPKSYKTRSFKIYRPSIYAFSFNLKIPNPNKIMREIIRPLRRLK